MEGRSDQLTRQLREKMRTSADGLDFENAARYRDQLTAIEKIETSKPDRGVVALRLIVLNQRGETVQDGRARLLMRRRPGAAESG